MSNNKQLAIIILNWNKAGETLRSVHEISQWSKLKAEIIIVDNGSAPEDISLLKNAGSRFQLVVNKRNLGYGGGNNVGINKALALGFEYIMLLNSDARITECCVGQLLECMRRSSALSVVGPILLEGGRSYAGGRNIGVYSMTRVPYEMQSNDLRLIPVDYVPGSALLAKRVAFERAGLLEEDYFFSGEVADFCWRVQSVGLMCAIYTGCRAAHAPDDCSDIRETLYSYYSMRNRFLFIRRHFGYTKFFWYLHWILLGVEQIAISLFKGKRKHAHALWLGLLDGILGRFGDRNAQFIK